MKNPPKCVGGNLRIISCQYFNQSTVSAPAQYISQFYTTVYYLPGLLQPSHNSGAQVPGTCTGGGMFKGLPSYNRDAQ